MKIFETLVEQLSQENNFVSDNGEIKKWVVLDKVRSFDEELIGLLLDNKVLKQEFFKDVKGTLVSDLNRFVLFLEQKNYLNDSFTKYKNKVGLAIDGKFLKQRNEVSLVWPFKDCVLEGGQSHEEDKREEIFFNEVLAQDEITQLFEPKVLANAKTYDKNGEHKFKNFTRDAALNKKRGLPEDTITDNLIIKGNNLLALHSLEKEFSGKVKLIYIDPPYNTGGDGFKYNDSFNHSTWLTFMNNRLSVAKKMLQNDGAIFLSIDLNEVGYLQVLCDGIFGEENRCGLMTVKRGSATGHKTINTGVVNLTEYVMIYANNKSEWKPNRIYKPRDRNVRYNNFILNRDKPISDWQFCSLLDAFAEHEGLPKNKLKKQLGGNFEKVIYSFVKKNASAVIQFAYPDADKVSKDAKALIVDSKANADEIFLLKRDNYPDLYLRNGQRILFYSDRLVEIDGEVVTAEPMADIWDDVLPNDLHNEGGVKLKKGKKPEKLLKRICELGASKHDIVLDFHIGSGTSAAVAHKMGFQYIGVEQLDYGKNDSVVRLQNVIAGDKTGVSKAVKWTGGGSFTYLELKKYNQSFIERIETAMNSKTLLEVWDSMKEKSFLDYNLDIIKQDEHIEGFKALSLEEQKQHLCEILDKNQLYVNLSSLEDKEFACTGDEKNITRDFYKMKA